MRIRGICTRLLPAVCAALIGGAGLLACIGKMTVDMPPYKPGRGNVFSDIPSRRVAVEAHNAPGAPAGERANAPGMSMGNVSFLPGPGALVRELLESELAAGGHEIVEDSPEVSLVADVERFDIRTESTPMHTDVIGEVSIRLTATSSEYRARCVKRTYDKLAESLIVALFTDCLARIGTQFRSDFAVARILASSR